MWCPKCRNEYVKGITKCPDCDCDLVEELEEIKEDMNPGMAPIVVGTVSSEEEAEKYLRFFKFSGLMSAISLKDENSGKYLICLSRLELEHYKEVLDVLVETEVDEEAVSANDTEVDEEAVSANDTEVDEKTDDSADKEDSAPDNTDADSDETDDDDVIGTVFQGSIDDLDKIPELFNFDDFIGQLDTCLRDIEDEEAEEYLSDLRTETSTVYVNKKDKYADFKFSGISFIVFSILGYIFVVLNLLKVINLFNPFSMCVMAVVFTVFLGIGISSINRANKIKSLVGEEEDALDDINDYIENTFDDNYFETNIDTELDEQEQYFALSSKMKKELVEKFPHFNANYLESLADERFDEYYENKNKEN